MDEFTPDTSGMKSARALYETLSSEREPFLERARRNSRHTIPYLIREEGDNGFTDEYDPYQSIGAMAVNHLTGRILLSQLPPSTKFFRLRVTEEERMALTSEASQEEANVILGQLEEALSDVEDAMLRELESRQLRISAFELMRHLIVAGNGVLYFDPEGKVRVYRLDEYVVERSGKGDVQLLIIKECIKFGHATPATREALVANKKHTGESYEDDTKIDLFTVVRRTDSGWTVHQEAEDVRLEHTEGTYGKNKCPWIVLRWNPTRGEHYGRAKVDDDIGDLRALEGMHKGIVEVSIASAKTLFMVNPNGLTSDKDIIEAENLDVIFGRDEDVNILRVEKIADMQVASATSDKIERRIARSYLMQSSVQRDAERVTAAEIRYMANELETSLGGIYSLFADEFQLPIVNVIRSQMQKARKLPALPDDKITPSIVTGIDALGRSHELELIRTALLGAGEVMATPGIGEYLNGSAVLRTFFTALGVPQNDLILSEEQIQQRQDAARQQALIEKGVGPVAGQVAKAATEQQGTA